MNMMDINSIVETFIDKYSKGITTMHRMYFKNDNEISIRALKEELINELKTGCVTFLNKEENEDYDINELYSYLFYITNDFCKKKAVPEIKKKTEYICPGCLYLGKEKSVLLVNKHLKCNDCEFELKKSNEAKNVTFYRTFFKHNKLGYRCDDCERFIPHPMDDSTTIVCPYFDCAFVGNLYSLKRMHHPSIQRNVESLILDAANESGKIYKNSIPDESLSALSKLEKEENINNQVKILKDIIDYQKNNVPYCSSDITVMHKNFCYDAFNSLLDKFPNEMVSYLLESSRSGGFQCKVFQEYIRLLDNSLPYSFKKNNKQYLVESLLDENLTLFDGISVFEGVVSNKLEIKNNTKEFYIGGRKGAISKPFYIGKLLSVNEKNNKASIIDNVIDYSFSKIKMKDIAPGTEVIVTHLRVPPHYQMGGMSYVNRVRKKIIERASFILSKNTDE